MKKYITLVTAVLFVLQQAACFAAGPMITGVVTAVNGSELTVNKGTGNGVRPGGEGIVYYQRDVGGGTVRLSVARVQVAEATAGTSRLRILEQTAEIKEGYNVDMETAVPSPPSQSPVQPQSIVKPPKKTGKKWYIIGAAVVVGGTAAALSSKKSSSGSDDSGTAAVNVTLPQ